jgi:adenosine deaminase
MAKPSLSRELIARLPKSDLHLHLDGSLRLPTLIELARWSWCSSARTATCRST